MFGTLFKTASSTDGDIPAEPTEGNPYELLDQYIEEVVDQKDASKSDEASSLRNEVSLLRNLMLYERHRRETLGLRNRRLLGKTKSSRILEEQNIALVRSSNPTQ